MAADSPAYRKWYPTVLALAGIALSFFGLRSLGSSYAITRWPVVPVRVIHSSIDSLSGGLFRPRVAYELYLAGRRYVGGGITQPATAEEFEGSGMPLSQAEAIVARYAIGQEMLAGYDPVNPARTVLHPRFNWWTTVPIVIGALIAALGIMIARERRRAAEPVSAP